MILGTAIGVLAALYLLVGAGMYLFQRSLIYVPDGTRTLPAAAGLAGIEERLIETPDGEQVVAWYGEARPGRPTVLYFHGNGGSLADRSLRISILREAGFGVLMMSYRSYSGSTGSPSEAANVADAGLAYDLLRRQGVPPRQIVLFGESLGTGVAVQLAEAREVGGLILDSPYTSLADVAAGHYPWLPVRALILDRYELLGRIAKVRAPLLVLHGEADEVIPLAMGKAVFAAANEPKRLATFPGAFHIHHVEQGSFRIVAEFLDGLAAGRPVSAGAGP